MDILTLKTFINEFKYWQEVCFLILSTSAFIILVIKRTRAWLIEKAKWLYSIWPYTIIKKQNNEIERLKGSQLSHEEIAILQALWAYGTDVAISEHRIMKMLECESQKASYLVEKLSNSRRIYFDPSINYEGYRLNTLGRKYIVDNGLEISLQDFLKKFNDPFPDWTF